MKNTLAAGAALLGKDPNGRSYSRMESNLKVLKQAAVAKPASMDTLAAIKAAVIDGEKERIETLVSQAIAEGNDTNTITEKALTVAMNEIGIDFGAGRVFCRRFYCQPKPCALLF